MPRNIYNLISFRLAGWISLTNKLNLSQNNKIEFWIAAIIFAIVCCIGIPLFLRMPIWTDVTLYDVMASEILCGGIPYQDTFDTRPPGFILLVLFIRSIFGFSFIAIRIADLVILSCITLLLARIIHRASEQKHITAWFVTAVAFFYLFTSQFNHCQVDVWMMLPFLILASRILNRPVVSRIFLPSFIDGIIGGICIWLKPHAFIPMFGLWAFTQKNNISL